MRPTGHSTRPVSPRQRVNIALQHLETDRVPADFLATAEVWNRMIHQLRVNAADLATSQFFESEREAVLRALDIDCRVVSYDQFCQPPAAALHGGAEIEWWKSAARSTPNRMWRQRTQDGSLYDVWGHHLRQVDNAGMIYEEYASWPLGHATTLTELRSHAWPEPDWWDFASLADLVGQLDEYNEYHIRFRAGSVFEISWQLRGMEQFLADLVLDRRMAEYIMDRVAEVVVENTRRVLDRASDRLDMVYFYDDVATQNGLMISRALWHQVIRPRHARIVEIANAYGKQVMYHCDGAVYPLIPDLIGMGINLLSPLQRDAKGMDLERLKGEFGDRLNFHGGIDTMRTLPWGSSQEVEDEVRKCVGVLGKGGGYVLASSHHIQPDTPAPNVLRLYDVALRTRAG